MVDSRITADDALISTDVDRLIRIIAERKRISFVELQRLSGIRNRSNLETWIRVLEDEGYVKVEYGITGVYVIWAESAYLSRPVEKSKSVEEPVAPVVANTKDEPDEEFKMLEKEEKIDENKEMVQSEQNEDEKEEKTPEELLEEYVKTKRARYSEETEEKEDDKLKGNVLKNFDEAVNEEEEREEIEEKEEIPQPALLEENPMVTENELEQTEKTIYEDNEVKDLIAAYMEEIKDEREKLAQLNRKKEMFYREEISNLQKMSEGELLSLIDAILAQEKKLLEIKESVMELPDKVDSTIKLKEELRTLSEQAKIAAKNNKNNIEEVILSLRTSQSDLKNRLDDIKALIEDNERKVNALETLRSSIDSKAEKVILSMDAARSRIDELKGMLGTMEHYLEETKKTKQDIDNALAEMHKINAEKQIELEAIENELEELNKLSAWVREYVNDYDSKIAEIEEIVQKSDRDLAALRQSAHAAYLKKYLAELQRLSDKYENKLENALKTEKEIDDEIQRSKERIAALVRESQKIIERTGSETKEYDYEEIKKKVEARSNKLKRMIEEKTTEKKNLSESIKKRKKGKKK